jgi:Na+/glutamate symporter
MITSGALVASYIISLGLMHVTYLTVRGLVVPEWVGGLLSERRHVRALMQALVRVVSCGRSWWATMCWVGRWGRCLRCGSA